MAKVVYRVGDLDKYKRKADSLYSMDGRGSGYFGTGYYFCTRPERCITITRENEPLYELKLKDGLRFLTGTQELHEGLKTFTRFVYAFPLLKDDDYLQNCLNFARIVGNFITDPEDCDLGDRLKNDLVWYEGHWKEYYSQDYSLKNLTAAASKIELSELADVLRSDNPDFDWINEFQKEHKRFFNYEGLKGLRDLKFHATEILAIDLHTTAENLMSIANDFYEIYKDFYKDYCFRVDTSMSDEDSISTFLLKSLGYDGVWPSPECDDTYYGGVVFDLENFTYRRLADSAKDFKGLKESRRVTIFFDDEAEAEDFKQEMKNRYKYPASHSRYQVLHGRGRTGKSVFVEKTN